MISSPMSGIGIKNRVSSNEEDDFITRLHKYINKEVLIKIEQDDTPINYTLKVIGKDYIVVIFAHMERTIPTHRILFYQAETHMSAPN